MTKRYVLAVAAAVLLLWASPLRTQDRISVMTQNQYLGADLTPIIAAPDLAAFQAAVTDALVQVAANNFPLRAKLLAQQLVDRNPDVVALQEVYKFECAPSTHPLCNDPVFSGAFNDQLSLTMGALEELGAEYLVGPSVRNLHVPIGIDTDGVEGPDVTITVTDRDVILVHD